ncbi:MAG: endo alpha-1,4 polygalactosaminidase [Alphaproteobacteria bacterium]
MRSMCAVAILAVGATAAGAREMPLPRWDWVIGADVDVATLIDRRLDYVGLDAFDVDAAAVAALRKAGMHVWCYVSAGTVEDWRPDLDAYEAADAAAGAAGEAPLIGAAYDDWAGERWLNPRALDRLMPLVEARLALCAEKGFDMVEFDNVDAFDNETGFDATPEDSRAFAQALAEAARRAGLAPILKNAPDLAAELEPWFAGYLMEECVLWDFCDSGAAFSAAGKPVFNAEYPSAYEEEGLSIDLAVICADGAHGDVSMLIKPAGLTMETKPCP